MLRKDGAVKLLDFGIARFAEEDSLTLTKSLVGSPAFMSPEQVKTKPMESWIIEVTSFLWALCCINSPWEKLCRITGRIHLWS